MKLRKYPNEGKWDKAEISKCKPCNQEPFDWLQFFKELFCWHHAVRIDMPDPIGSVMSAGKRTITYYECHRCGKDMTDGY